MLFSEMESRCGSENQTELVSQWVTSEGESCPGHSPSWPLELSGVTAYGKLPSTPFQPHCWNSDSISTELAHRGHQVGMGAVESVQHWERVESGRKG